MRFFQFFILYSAAKSPKFRYGFEIQIVPVIFNKNALYFFITIGILRRSGTTHPKKSGKYVMKTKIMGKLSSFLNPRHPASFQAQNKELHYTLH